MTDLNFALDWISTITIKGLWGYDLEGFYLTSEFICLIIVIVVFGGAYYISPKSCPMCESVNWETYT